MVHAYCKQYLDHSDCYNICIRTRIWIFHLFRCDIDTAFFLVTGIIGIFSATKRVEVYRGFVIYHKGFTKKEYPISDIKTSKSQTETYSVGCYEDRVAATGHDSVTIFYDKNGKPIFKFGLAYENVERLKDDVKKAREK